MKERSQGEHVVCQHGQICLKKWKRGVAVVVLKPLFTLAVIAYVFA